MLSTSVAFSFRDICPCVPLKIARRARTPSVWRVYGTRHRQILHSRAFLRCSAWNAGTIRTRHFDIIAPTGALPSAKQNRNRRFAPRRLRRQKTGSPPRFMSHPFYNRSQARSRCAQHKKCAKRHKSSPLFERVCLRRRQEIECVADA